MAASNTLTRQAEATMRTPEGEALNDLVLTIFKVSGRLNRAGDALSRDLGLTSARWQVLGATAAAPRTVAQIARHYELTRQGVLWVVRAMVKDGLVELVHNPDHRRAKLVRHTAAGAALYGEISRRQHHWVNGLAESFDVGELERGTALLGKLGAILIDDDDDPDSA